MHVMKIGIMCSIDFANEAADIKKRLEAKGHVVSMPYTIEKILSGDMQLADVLKMKSEGAFSDYAKSGDLIRRNWERMKNDDAILVVNIEKNGIPNYIGGNTFLEMGFAHVLNMNIYLWRDIPNMTYSDELKAMNPIVLNEDIESIDRG